MTALSGSDFWELPGTADPAAEASKARASNSRSPGHKKPSPSSACCISLTRGRSQRASAFAANGSCLGCRFAHAATGLPQPASLAQRVQWRCRGGGKSGGRGGARTIRGRCRCKLQASSGQASDKRRVSAKLEASAAPAMLKAGPAAGQFTCGGGKYRRPSRHCTRRAESETYPAKFQNCLLRA